MALITNTLTRYDGTRAVREDLSNYIYNIAPTECPVMSNSGRDTAKQTFFEWQTDGLATASNTPVIEGDDIVGTTDLRAPTNRVNNYTQINRKIITVSGTLEAVDKAGMKSYLAYELAKAASEMKRDMETAVTGMQIGVAGSNSVARKTAGMGAWIITNFSAGAGTGAVPIMSGGAGNGTPGTAAVAGTPRALTEALFKTAQQNVWIQGGNPKVAYMGATQKVVFSTFAGIATRFRDVPAGKQADIVGAADTYIGDFGETDAVPTRFIPASIVYVGDPEYMSLAYLRPMTTEVMARTADGQKRMLICEWGLRMKSQYSWAAIADLT
jgi:Family of unknown function (DUF5309)